MSLSATPTSRKCASRRLSAAFKSPLQKQLTSSPKTQFSSSSPRTIPVTCSPRSGLTPGTPGITLSTRCTPEAKHLEDLSAMKSKLQELATEIETLHKQGLKEEELQIHIDKLHEYNEIKDVGQMVIGRLAVLEGVRSQDLYHRYGLDLED